MEKKSASYKIDIEILQKFNEKADQNALNKSKWIENKMVEYLKEVDN